MGDQLGDPLHGRLAYLPARECKRLLAVEPKVRVALVADACRLNTLYMVARAGSGHLGSSFSSLDVATWLHLEYLGDDDVYFSSKGHDAPGLYALQIALGHLPESHLHELRRLGGLPGHPDVGTETVIFNTGSLGMGISKASGLILGHRRQGRESRVVVMTGDGELQEGQIWESLRPAVIHRLQELTVVVDHNRLQSDTYVRNVSDLGDLGARFASHGWTVRQGDGHDAAALSDMFNTAHTGPLVVIADTVKGRGVSFMESTAMASDQGLYRFHSGAPSREQYVAAFAELRERVDARLAACGEPPLDLVEVDVSAPLTAPGRPQRCVDAHSRALISAATADDRIVALDGDLMLDLGLIPFRDRFPDRFFECGIAEQHMVSMAGGMAAAGLLPVVHSFASFLSSRPNEQIFNNATERRPIVYVGALAGLLPGGPGHSHQAVRDIAALGAVPDLVTVHPATEVETQQCTAWALRQSAPVYVRLTSVPVVVPFEVPDAPLVRGVGRTIRDGDGDVAVMGYGPTMLTEAWHAADRLAANGVNVAVIDHPFPALVDPQAFLSLVGDTRLIITIDDHDVDGALGSAVAAVLASQPRHPLLVRFGVHGIPVCGTGDEVLRAHGLDRAGLAESWQREINALG
jgi:transketolase